MRHLIKNHDFFISIFSLIIAALLQLVLMSFMLHTLSAATVSKNDDPPPFKLAKLFENPAPTTPPAAIPAPPAEELHDDTKTAVEPPSTVEPAEPPVIKEIATPPEPEPPPVKPEKAIEKPQTKAPPQKPKPVKPKAKTAKKPRPAAKPEKSTATVTKEPTHSLPKQIMTDKQKTAAPLFATQTLQVPESAATTKTQPLSASEKEDMIRQYLADIFSIIEANKVYPERARRRNSTGSIDVEFSIDLQGKPQNVKQISQRRRQAKILTEAALKLVNSLSFPPPPQDWDAASRITISISYKLR